MNHILNHTIPGAKDFTWGEALYLRQWDVHVYPNELIAKNIMKTASKLQDIRDMFGMPIRITSWWRPPHYNVRIGGAMQSAHIDGLAVDFIVLGKDCDIVREVLRPKLELMGIRMENHGGNWIHIDLKPPGISGRYFRP